VVISAQRFFHAARFIRTENGGLCVFDLAAPRACQRL
jgi:hypothetical protein